jgi:hypothetical protein
MQQLNGAPQLTEKSDGYNRSSSSKKNRSSVKAFPLPFAAAEYLPSAFFSGEEFKS